MLSTSTHCKVRSRLSCYLYDCLDRYLLGPQVSSAMLASKGFRLALQATGVLAIVFALLHWQFGGVQNVLPQTGREVAVQEVKEELHS